MTIPALADLAPLIFFVGCLLFCYLCILIVKALFGTASSATSWIPWVGTAIDSGLHKAEQHVVSIFQAGAAKSESYIGLTWHWSARMIDWLGREINSHANLLLTLARVIPGAGLVERIYADIALALRDISRLWRSTPADIRAVAKPIYGELKALERWTYPRVKAAEHAIDVTIPKDVAGLRARTRTIENSLDDLWKYMRTHPWTIVTDTFIGAVAIALTRLDLGWLRCPSLTKLGKKFGCGLGNLLDGLLGIVVSTLVLENICTLLPLLETAFGDVVGPVTHLLTEVPLGGCETPPKSWARLAVAAGPLPPQQTLGALPI